MQLGLGISVRQIRKSVTTDPTPGGILNVYARPDGISTYKQPGGSRYLRP
jgi:hypothetical protein